MRCRLFFRLLASLVVTVAAGNVALSQTTLPQISTVSFSNTSPYTLTITGGGFGQPTVELPYTGDLSNFRIGDNAQLGHGEWGYTGDSNMLTYESWSDTSITVSGFGGSAGDSIGIALWNSSTGIGATWGGNVPSSSVQITGVELWASGQNLIINVHGSGFGSQPWTGNNGYSGDINFFEFIDYRTHCGASSSLFNAGGARFGNGQDAVSLNYESWSDSDIYISAFGSGYGQGCATYQTGDPITVAVWNTNDTDDAGPQASFSGQGSTVAGIVNSVHISSVNVTNSLPCIPGGYNCFSIQQNFYMSTPSGTGFPSYWFQNGVQLAQVAGTWQARAAYCEQYLPKEGKPTCHYEAWAQFQQTFPPILLESTVKSGTSDDVLQMITSLGSGNEYSKSYPIPTGSLIIGAAAAQEATGGMGISGAILPAYEPELVLVGEYTNQQGSSTATFSSPTSGYVISGLSIAGGVAQKPGSAAPTTSNCVSTGETSTGLSWLVNQNNPARAGFSATGTGTQEGVIYVPALVASGLGTCSQ